MGCDMIVRDCLERVPGLALDASTELKRALCHHVSLTPSGGKTLYCVEDPRQTYARLYMVARSRVGGLEPSAPVANSFAHAYARDMLSVYSSVGEYLAEVEMCAHSPEPDGVFIKYEEALSNPTYAVELINQLDYNVSADDWDMPPALPRWQQIIDGDTSKSIVSYWSVYCKAFGYV